MRVRSNRLIETSKKYQTFEPESLLYVASIYSDAREKLARFFDYLPPSSKKKFYNFADEVRKYEEKESAEGGVERMKL